MPPGRLRARGTEKRPWFLPWAFYRTQQSGILYLFIRNKSSPLSLLQRVLKSSSFGNQIGQGLNQSTSPWPWISYHLSSKSLSFLICKAGLMWGWHKTMRTKHLAQCLAHGRFSASPFLPPVHHMPWTLSTYYVQVAHKSILNRGAAETHSPGPPWAKRWTLTMGGLLWNLCWVALILILGVSCVSVCQILGGNLAQPPN